MRPLAATLLCLAALSGCEGAINPNGVPPPAGGGGSHAVQGGRLGAAGSGAAGAAGAHSVRAGSLGSAGSGAADAAGHRVLEGGIHP